MTRTSSRREFIGAGVAAGGCLWLCPLVAQGGDVQPRTTPASPVFDETMSYCCAECTPEKCQWLGNDMDFKTRKAREISDKLAREIKPEEITCSRCRVPEERAFDAIKKCPIRQCVIEKNLTSCAHCGDLEGCQRANPKTRGRALAIRRVVLGA